jgi:hypothetical protein
MNIDEYTAPAMAFLSTPLYVPSDCRELIEVLAVSGPNGLLEKLHAKIESGSTGAAAMLADLYLHVQGDGKRHLHEARRLCEKGALSGDAYCEYVLAWCLFYDHDRKGAYAMMSKASQRDFPPAITDLMLWTWTGIGTELKEPRDILPFIRRAVNSGHATASGLKASIYVSGKLGLLRAILGLVIYPFGCLKPRLALIGGAFDSKTYSFSYSFSVPPFRKGRRFVIE